MWPDEALEPSLDRWPFDPRAAERIGTVEHEHIEAARGRSLEAIQHRRLKRVIAAADVLQVGDQRFDVLKLLGRRPQTLECFAVKAVDPPSFRPRVADANQILRLA